ncbi:uncharacterized protein BDR25DRAFT_360823 [Lindgomyces ingoldianus]|uniref:Uncharacterized protein n=1 Tax=Lindgomyces ingoldianus TaxID=673940 RepID=A0ACB6QDT8_9PLEO|nr:uncharacterized protein BDR25DRAFT_360823 [Lindgomyces ingoldianus]KAF2465194.1 hypothetical protein BDR25DRAFT_360823 [Lindgomyces ingoldianus]
MHGLAQTVMTQLAVPHSPNDVGWKALSPALSELRDRTDKEWLQLLDKSLTECTV